MTAWTFRWDLPRDSWPMPEMPVITGSKLWVPNFAGDTAGSASGPTAEELEAPNCCIANTYAAEFSTAVLNMRKELASPGRTVFLCGWQRTRRAALWIVSSRHFWFTLFTLCREKVQEFAGPGARERSSAHHLPVPGEPLDQQA